MMYVVIFGDATCNYCSGKKENLSIALQDDIYNRVYVWGNNVRVTTAFHVFVYSF
jgi:hypothetical protein